MTVEMKRQLFSADNIQRSRVHTHTHTHTDTDTDTDTHTHTHTQIHTHTHIHTQTLNQRQARCAASPFALSMDRMVVASSIGFRKYDFQAAFCSGPAGMSSSSPRPPVNLRSPCSTGTNSFSPWHWSCREEQQEKNKHVSKVSSTRDGCFETV